MSNCGDCSVKLARPETIRCTRCYSIYRVGRPRGEYKTKSNVSEKNCNWKGDAAGYGALHAWVRKRKNKPSLCERCKKTQPHDLANISGEYKRDINDFEWLCRRCHMTGDGRINNLKQYGGGLKSG